MPSYFDGFFQRKETGVWPELVDVVNLYIRMQTQTRGTGGFDYSAIPVVMDMLRLSKDEEDRSIMFEDFCTLEDEYLTIMAERREKAERERNRR